MTEQEIQFTTNSFILDSTFWSIIIASQGALALMFIPMALGVPVLICALFFILSIYYLIRILTAKATYTLNESGVSRILKPNLFESFWSKRIHTHLHWNEIESYVIGSDATRGLQEYNYLTIKSSNHKFSINDKNGDVKGFDNFKNTFVKFATSYNANIVKGHLNKEVTENSSKASTLDEKPIKREKSFYETLFAKILTIFFVFLSVALLLFLIQTGNTRISNWFRFLILIIPGTLYMVYRVFVEKKD